MVGSGCLDASQSVALHIFDRPRQPLASLDATGKLAQPADFNTLANKPVPAADGTYITGFGTATNGTITLVGGLITAIQPATNLPPPPAFTASGFGEASVNGAYDAITPPHIGAAEWKHRTNNVWVIQGVGTGNATIRTSKSFGGPPLYASFSDVLTGFGGWNVVTGSAPAGTTA